jgi:diaminohydroxyphosphoribosylaminopyrimidine deaminase/5-amino-6-(5-phosphoribosylamino)uracil reductase
VRKFDEELMAKAIEIAKNGDPSPNPHVGSIVVRDEGDGYKIVGRGHHEEAGHDHAEVIALREAGDLARGATVYVTLEPCSHEGRTPPCVLALQKAGVKRVVIGCRDPNPNVSGGGAARLQASGIEVTLGVLEDQAKTLIEPWAKFITQGLSFLTLKLALSLDGRIATKTGQSKWITSKESRAFVHELRARSDAVMVGINTVMSDDPRLTVRAATGRNPIRLIIDSKLRLPLDRRVVQTAKNTPTCVLTTAEADPDHKMALEDMGLNIITLPATAEGRCDMKAALRELAKREVVSVLCEGGSELAGSLLAGQLIDRMQAFIAPVLLGPRGRAGAVDWAGPDSLSNAPRIEQPKWALHGNDAHVSGRLVYGSVEPSEKE